MNSEAKVWVDLNDEEVSMLEVLQADMGLASTQEVMHVLIRQAHSRAAIVCPNCGHSAQRNAADEARCESCLSILQLSNDIWQVVATRAA